MSTVTFNLSFLSDVIFMSPSKKMVKKTELESMTDLEFTEFTLPLPPKFWAVHPPTSPSCLKLAQILLRTRVNYAHKTLRIALREYLKTNKLKPASIPDAKQRKVYREAFGNVFDPLKAKDWPQDPRNLRIPENQAHRLPTTSEQDLKCLGKLSAPPDTTPASITTMHQAWCALEPRTMLEYLDRADLVSELEGKMNRSRVSKQARSKDKYSQTDRSAFKHWLEGIYAGRDLESIYNLYNLWLKRPRTKEEYIDHADVICDLEARTQPFDILSVAKKRGHLRRWYGKMSIPKMHLEHRRWCQEELHTYEDYIDHAIVVSQLNKLCQSPDQALNDGYRFETSLELSKEFRQMFWNRYHDKPLEDIYWDREHWLQRSPHSVEEYRDHSDIVRKMEQRPLQPKLSVPMKESASDPPAKSMLTPRTKSRTDASLARGSSDASPILRRSNRIVKTTGTGAPSTKSDNQFSTGNRPRKRSFASIESPSHQASQKAPTRSKRPPFRNDSSKQNSKRKPATIDAATPQEDGQAKGTEPDEQNVALTKPPQLTAFESSLLEVDGWRWYPYAAPFLPFPETRYIAALTDLKNKFDLRLRPGKFKMSLLGPCKASGHERAVG